MVQMLGWFSAEAARASRWKRSSASGVLASSSERNFKATWRPRVMSWASYTTPIPPPPSFRQNAVMRDRLADHARELARGGDLRPRSWASQRAAHKRHKRSLEAAGLEPRCLCFTGPYEDL